MISDRSTEQTIYFQGAIGYNNAVYLLNDLAQELYSNNNLNGSARSINSDDLEIHMTDEGLENIHSYTPYGGVKWGQTKTYTLGLYYPGLYEYENGSGIDLENINDPNTETKLDGISQSSGYYDSPTQETYRQAKKSLTVKQTYYESSMNMGYYDNSVFL